MQVESFMPAVDGIDAQVNPVSISVADAVVGRTQLPKGGPDYEFTNESASGIAYIKFFKEAAPTGTATLTTGVGLPILAGQTKVYRAPSGLTQIAHIGAGACTLKVAVGTGI